MRSLTDACSRCGELGLRVIEGEAMRVRDILVAEER
jgi:hypothetical protein